MNSLRVWCRDFRYVLLLAVATATEPGNRVLIIDNVRLPRRAKEIASSVLERCVTGECQQI